MNRPNVQALRAALTVMEALHKEHIQATCGIDASLCVTGNVGSLDSLMFTELHGDAVDSAMAMCGLAKDLATNVLLTEVVKKDCTESCIMRLVAYKRPQSDTVALPTRSASDVPLYEALQLRTSEKENPDLADEWMYVMQEEEKIIEGHKVFENGIKLFFEGKKEEAYAVLGKVLEKDPKDSVAKKFLSFQDLFQVEEERITDQSTNRPCQMNNPAVDLLQCYGMCLEGKYEEAKTTLEKCTVKDHHYDRLMAAIVAGTASSRSQV